MTDKISDGARELAFYAMNVTGVTTVKLERRMQSALNAARNQALEDAARYIEQDGLQQSLAEAEAIRAMKVQP